MQAICLLLMGPCVQAADLGNFAVLNLRCEDLVDPIGIDVLRPRLSWQMQADNNGAAQTAYQILCATAPELLQEGAADLWDSGKVASDACRQIPYDGKTLAQGAPFYWSVRVWDEKGTASPWSPPAMWTRFDMAATKDWQAKWITHPASSPWLRKSVELAAIPERAYVYVNSVGFFQLYINGKRVGADEFAPHVSQPDKRRFCLTYDVTDYLVEGKNAIGLWLGQGWSGHTDIHGAPRLPSPVVRAQLEMADAKGEITTLATDDSWRANNSCMTYRGHWGWNRFGGEVHNGALDQPDWADADFDDSKWPKATLAKVPDTIVSAEMLQRSHVIETITPVTVTNLSAVAAATANNRIAPDETIDIRIKKALYGIPGDSARQVDVREKLQAIADAGQYRVDVSNTMAGKNPAPGRAKQLVLEYVLNGREITLNLNEHEDYMLAVVGEGSANWLVDMGKAMTGTFDITFPKGAKGQVVTMEFGDAYTPGNKPGELPMMNHYSQISEYICRGSGTERFRNRFNYASCRYILIRNAPEGEITAKDIKGSFITTDLPKASTFSCSDETLNEIYSMIEHTLRCLMLGGYQVDCHSRERNGYGGDGQASLDTTLNFLRADAFYRKWTQDWVDGQKPGGEIMNTSPASNHGGGPFWPGFLTAATLKSYLHYGDLPLVQRNYPAIKKWLEMAQRKTVDDLQLQFCGGGYLGDWATPKGLRDENNDAVFIHSYMAYVLGQAAQLADILGETSDANTFRAWAAARNKATHKKFYNPDTGSYGADQVTYVLPLMAGVVPDELTEDLFAGFEETLLVKDKGHLSTGLSGTYLMIEYLQSIGRDDLIYTFASKRTFPSWGYMIENGATATWECWHGQPGRLCTMIHNCYNSIGAWFIQSLAGIRPDPQNPGFKNAIIKPAFLKELSYVNGSHDSVYGTIQSNWKRESDAIIMTIKIPANSTATAYLPAQSAADVTVNGVSIEKAEHVTLRRIEKGRTVVDLGAGSYEIVCRQPATSENKKAEANRVHGLVGLRPLPRTAEMDHGHNHGGSWAGTPTFAEQKGKYPFVAEHLDVVKGWLDGDFKTKRVFFEYYWGLSEERDDLDPEKNLLVKTIREWEAKGAQVEHILICREYDLAIHRGYKDAKPGPFKEDTRILFEKDYDDIRAMFKQANKLNILKHSNYKLIQMVQEPSFFATDKRFLPILDKCDGIAYECHQFNRHWPLETGWSKPEKVVTGAKWTLDQDKEYIFYYGPIRWEGSVYYEFMERDWLQKFWKAGLPKHHPKMHYYLNTFPHEDGRGRPVGPETDPHSILGFTKWLIQEIK